MKKSVQSLTVCFSRSKAAESSPKVVEPGSFVGSSGLWLLELTRSLVEKVVEGEEGENDGGDTNVLRPRKGVLFLVLYEEEEAGGRRRWATATAEDEMVPTERAKTRDCIFQYQQSSILD